MASLHTDRPLCGLYPHHKIMSRFAAYFRYLENFQNLVNLPYTMKGKVAVFSPTTQLWAVLWPISSIWCIPVFSEFTLHNCGPLCGLWAHQTIMSRFVAYFRYLVPFRFFVNLSYTMVGNIAAFGPNKQLWAVLWPISGIWCTSGF